MYAGELHHWQRYSAEDQQTQQADPDISLLDPALQKQWDHAANAHLGHIVITPRSTRKVQWICEHCPDNYLHRWSAAVTDRTAGSGCPQCSGKKVCKHNSLATKAPGIAAQWDYEENAGCPDSVVAQSHQVVGWLCDMCAHKWRGRIDARAGKCKTGCPSCANMARTKNHFKRPTFAECQDPEMTALLAEWDYKRNAAEGNYTQNTTLGSAKPIWWLCKQCPAGQEHRWTATPRRRTSFHKTGCPVCAGKVACQCNSLQALYPNIAAEWDFGQNAHQPKDYVAGSCYLAWWSSPQRGSWQQVIHSRTTGERQRSARLRIVKQRQDFTGFS